MTKVVVFSNMYPSAEHPTYGIFVKNQVEQLKNDGIDLQVIAIHDPGRGKIGKITKYLSWGTQSLLYTMRHKKNISITHAHYAFPTGMVSLLAKKLFGIPYIVTLHGGDLDKMAKKSPRIAAFTKSILEQSSAVIVVGEKLRDDVINDYGIAADKVDVMSMGVDTNVFKPMGQEEVRLLLDVPLNERVILFVGNVIEAKGTGELVEAFERLQQSHDDLLLYIVGSQKDRRFASELKERVAANPDIRFKEPVSQTELAKWMSAADILALPSYHEGFGLVALEALASGAKVVATRVGGLPYLLGDGAGKLVEPRDAQALADGLEEMLGHEVSREQHDLIQQVIKQHSSEEIIRRLKEIYARNGKGSSK